MASQGITVLIDIELALASISYLVSTLFLLHFYAFKREQYEKRISSPLVKFPMLLVLCGLLKNIFGLPSLLVHDYYQCSTLIGLARVFGTAEQLYSFIIALSLFFKSYTPLSKLKIYDYEYYIMHPLIWIISIILGVLNGLAYFVPNSACIIQSTPLLVQIASIIFIIVFIVNMIVFILFFIASRKIFGNTADNSLITKKEEVILYLFLFLVFGVLRAPLYIDNIFSHDPLYLYVWVDLNVLSSILVPVIFGWNFGIFGDYKKWILNICCKEDQNVANNDIEVA